MGIENVTESSAYQEYSVVSNMVFYTAIIGKNKSGVYTGDGKELKDTSLAKTIMEEVEKFRATE